MKKLIIATLITLGSFSMVSADIGVNIGVSGNMSVFHGQGTETDVGVNETEKHTEDATGVANYGSWFIEKTLGFARVGYEFAPDVISSDTSENNRNQDDDGGALGTAGTDKYAQTNNVQVDFEQMHQMYVAVDVGNFYIKYGLVEVDVNTNEKLTTGSTYADATLDGTSFGFGSHRAFDNGMFVRFEGNLMDFDTVTLKSGTNTDNSIKVDQLEGASASIKVGKSF